MSATPTRVDWEAPLADPGLPLVEGNRVLESIGRQEGLRALLAFSDLHEQIQNRRRTTASGADWDLFQTERFVLEEVLQLICDRTQSLTQAEAIVVALAEGPAMVCRATAGPLPVPRGIRLSLESEFLRDCLESGKILRCDDSLTDARIDLDFAHQLGARSTVLVPLRGRSDRLGVLQAFSTTPWSFTDQDVRCFDLFAELVLAALRPEDQDRRIHWLSDVAGEVLQAKPVATAPVVADTTVSDSGHIEPLQVEVAAVEAATVEPLKIEPGELTPVGLLQLDPRQIEPAQTEDSTIEPVATNQDPELAVLGLPEARLPELDVLTQPVVIPVAAVEIREPELEPDRELDGELQDVTGLEPETPIPVGRTAPLSIESLPSVPQVRARLLGANLGGIALTSHPGLSVVMGLVAVAALFSAGVWWGMQVHGKAAVTKVGESRIAGTKSAASESAALRSVTSPPAPDVISPAVADNLMDPAQAASQSTALIAVPETKLAALPKITGVRHWSSSMGSTVVIDMEDQVPYEVHRLMSPERIYFDLHDTVLTHELDGKTMDVGDVSLTRVRVAQPVAGVTRIVLDTRDGSNFSVSMESNPYRLVVELRDTTKLAATNHAGPDALARAAIKPAPTAALEAKTSTQPLPARVLPVKTGKVRIVLDAGHGGWDLGTVGRQGLLEKDLVLDVTRRLGKLLRNRLGSEVMFTRTGDEYLPLDQRADFANQAQADLFVSVHANYSSSATARGVETYYTNLFSAPGSKEVEKHADGSFAQPTPVSLSAGGLHEKIEDSRRLAASVQRSLFATLAAKSPDIRDRGIKGSAFAVLTGTTMPAILTEISFVSSPEDEHNLQSEAYRQQIAEALYKGIARYQESSPRAKVAQLQPTAARR